VEFSDALQSLRRHWKFSVGIFLLAVIACGLFIYTRKTVRPPDRYHAAVEVLIPSIDSKGALPSSVPTSLLQGQSQLALSPNTEQSALAAAGLSKSAASGISFGFSEASGSTNAPGSTHGCTGSCSDVVTLSATANSPSVAETVSQAFASSYIAARRNVDQQSALDAARGRTATLQTLTKTLEQVDSDIARADPAAVPHLLAGPGQSSGSTAASAQNSTATVSAGQGAAAAVAVLPPGTPENVKQLVVERDALLSEIESTRQDYGNQYITSLLPDSFSSTLQSLSAAKISPPPPSNKVPIIAFLGIGLALALLIPILRDRFDRSIHSPKAAAEALDATVLTVLPPLNRRGVHALAPPGSQTEEAYRALAATSVATDRLPKSIVVTSPTGDLQDLVAANFAAALATLGLRVALVGTDPRQSWFANGHTSDNKLSFTELLNLAHHGELNGALSHALVPTQVDNLYVLLPGKGTGEPGLDGLAPLLSALSSNVDITVVAGPSLLEDPNATIFAWTTRSVLWAVEGGHTNEGDAKEAAARLELAGAAPFGIVMVSARQT
jgi:Mrp family chromosome partitioning ATPase